MHIERDISQKTNNFFPFHIYYIVIDTSLSAHSPLLPDFLLHGLYCRKLWISPNGSFESWAAHYKVITTSKVGSRCNPQNMTSLVCHCTKCTHTQYSPVRYGWLYIPLLCLLIQYRKLFWEVLKNFAKYREILPMFWEIIWKYLKEKSENFENDCWEFRGIFPKILRIISKIISKYF